MKYGMAALLFWSTLAGIAQIKFEKGFLINNAGNQIECYIRNVEWKNNPTEFEYKLSDNDQIQTGDLSNVRVFSIPGEFRYERHTVAIDLSKKLFDEDDLDSSAEANYMEETLFLKTLVTGKATLYLYDATLLRKFFYSVDDSNPKQLFYKRYKKELYRVAENNEYRQTLLNNVFCENNSLQNLETLDYDRRELIDYFENYNACFDEASQTIDQKEHTVNFNLNIRPGVSFNSLFVENTIYDIRTADFGDKTTFRLGLEAEFILGFNKGKWAGIIEPTYQYFKGEKEITFQTVEVDYSVLEVPAGIRHYFYLSEKSRIFLNGSYVFTIALNKEIAYESEFVDIDVRSKDRLALGLGFNYNEKFSAELRAYTNTSITNSDIYHSDFKTFSVIVGYTLF